MSINKVIRPMTELSEPPSYSRKSFTRVVITLCQFIAADSVITPEEFNLMAPKIIFSCAPDAADGDGLEDPTPSGNAKEKTDA